MMFEKFLSGISACFLMVFSLIKTNSCKWHAQHNQRGTYDADNEY